MARQRRGGFKTPELKGTLGTLIRTTLQQAGVVRDALERGAREGRSRLADARADRRRRDALAELGEIVLDLIRRDEIDLGELPEAKEAVRFLDHLDNDRGDARDDDDDDDADADITPPPTRRRFDERPSSRTGESDGTVSSGAKPSPSRRAGRPTSVWRPRTPAPPAAADTEPSAPAAPKSRTLPRDPHRKGGIRFDTDDDLADYMHPDDVPPKPPSEGES